MQRNSLWLAGIKIATPRPPLPLQGLRLLTAAQRMHEHGERVDGGGIEPSGPCGHHAGAAVGDSIDEGRLVRAIKPDLVSQVRRAEVLVARAIIAMAARAVVGEDFLRLRKVSARAARQAG